MYEELIDELEIQEFASTNRRKRRKTSSVESEGCFSAATGCLEIFFLFSCFVLMIIYIV